MLKHENKDFTVITVLVTLSNRMLIMITTYNKNSLYLGNISEDAEKVTLSNTII